MASVDELKEVLKEHLENDGTLNEIRSQLRSAIFKSLNDQPNELPKISKENILMNDLIWEYLEFNNFNYSKSVFDSECGNPPEKLDREIIASWLNVEENQSTKKLPLLYALVFGSKQIEAKEN